MTKSVFSLDTKAGIQRDGTTLDKQFYTAGEWVRFQRGRPRKIGGYRQISPDMHGYSRGIYVDSLDGEVRIFNGHSGGLERLSCDANGIGSGITQYVTSSGPILTVSIFAAGSLYTNGTYTGVTMTGNSGSRAEFTVTVAGGVVTAVTPTKFGNGYQVSTAAMVFDGLLTAAAADIGGTGSGMYVSIDSVTTGFTEVDQTLWQFDGFFDATGDGSNVLLAHPGKNLISIDNTTETPVMACDPAGVLVRGAGEIFPPIYPLVDSEGSTPTNLKISVTGGVVVLHPYVFVYGDNGLIKNSSAGNMFDWNSADSNEINVSAQKIVKGLAIRGGSNSPSGLFWSLDSLIRVSYSPIVVNSVQVFWRYDTVGSITILSSQSVIEYDGIYYWCGIDRFMLYNGVIKELPNDFNVNWFFDNLNFEQRQKVWATKVPRYGEIWWFYPRGSATECTDVIIYNVRADIWYDTGSAPGSARSAGYAAQGFRYPVSAGVELSEAEIVLTADVTTAIGNSVIATAANMNLRIGLLVAGVGIPVGSLITEIVATGTGYDVNLDQVCTAAGTVSATFSTIANRISVWQHEFGVNEIKGQNVNAIRSMFETDNIGLVTGGPSQAALVGDNHWIHIQRIEPDYLQSGAMNLYIIGKPYAQQEDITTGPYLFDGDTGKIDLREQRRQMRLKFVSDVQDGNYQMGALLISADMGDTRGHS